MIKKELLIPLTNIMLIIFVGEKGKELFLKEVTKIYPQWKDDENSDGYSFGSMIWIEDVKNEQIFWHELQHFFDWLFDYLNIREESEFKAYLVSYIICNIKVK